MFRRRIIIASLLLTIVSTAGFSQRLRDRGAVRTRRADRRLERVQQNLGLNESQRSGIQALRDNRKKELDSLQQELQQKRQALRQLLQQPNPNANEVGTATLALKELREQTRGINQRFLSGIRGLLTPDQMQRLPRRLQR